MWCYLNSYVLRIRDVIICKFIVFRAALSNDVKMNLTTSDASQIIMYIKMIVIVTLHLIRRQSRTFEIKFHNKHIFNY